MTHAKHLLALLLCFGMASLSAMNGSEETAQEKTLSVTAVAIPKAPESSASTPPVAQAATRKICPEPFAFEPPLKKDCNEINPSVPQKEKSF